MSRYWTDKTDNVDAVSAQDFNEAFKGISEDMSNVEMELSEVKKYIDAITGDIDVALDSITAIQNALIQNGTPVTPFTNLVPLSTEADGETIYNGGLGYKDNIRLSSTSIEKTDNGENTTITGYIPFTQNDKLYIYPAFVGGNTANTVNFYNGNYEHLGQVTDSGAYSGFCNGSFKTTLVNEISVLDISGVIVSGVENVAFVRVGNLIAGSKAIITSGSEMIITKNEEIEL